MFRNLLMIVLLIFLIFMGLPNAIAQNERKNNEAQAELPSEVLSEKLAGSLAHIAIFEISSKNESHFEAYPFLNNAIEGIEKYSFKSKKPVSENSQGKLYLRFQLTIIEYDSANSATAASDALLSFSDPNIGLSYAWDYLVIVNSKKYWLNAPCLLSQRNWQHLTAKLDEIIFDKIHEQKGSFECHCGLECRRNWEK